MARLSRFGDFPTSRALRSGAILVLSLAGATLAGREAALSYWRTHVQEGVPQILAGDPAIRLRQTGAYLAHPGELSRQAPAIGRAAREVLAATPLNALAMRQLGVVALIVGTGGEEKLRLAERISKRDAIGQILLIQLTAEDGSVSDVLAHYDRAVAVNPATKAQLFPVLAAGLDDAEIRKVLSVYAARAWFGDFLGKARGFGASPEGLFQLLADVDGRIPASTAQGIRRDLLWEAIRSGSTDVVRRLIAQLPGGGVDRSAFGFAAGAAEDGGANPLAWIVHEDDALSVSQASGGLTIRVTPERSGLAAERVTLFGPGDYQLSQSLAYDPVAPQARLAWTVDCLDGGAQRRLWAWDLPVSGGQVQAALSIPSDCPIQHWRIEAAADVSQLQAQVQISELKLSRE